MFTLSVTTGQIQIKVLTTLPLKFEVFYDKNKINCTIRKGFNIIFFGQFVTVLVQKLKKNVSKLICSQYLDSQLN